MRPPRRAAPYITPVLLLMFALPAHGVVFTVTRTDDQLDTNPGDGACTAQNGGGCSLRAAVQEANALSGADSIYLPAGTYSLTLGGAGENLAATGDLDITSAITIVGTGWKVTTVAMSGFDDRLFEVQGFSSLELADLSLSGGSVDGRGGGVLVQAGGSFKLSRSRIHFCFARAGAGIGSVGGSVTVEGSEIRDNFGVSALPIWGGNGPAIDAVDASVVVRRSSLHDNKRDADFEGIVVRNSSLLIERSTVVDDHPTASYYSVGATDSDVTIVSSTIGRLDVTGASSLTLGCSLVKVCTLPSTYTNYGFNVFGNGAACVGVNDTNFDWDLTPLMAPPGKFLARVPTRFSAALDGGHGFVCIAEDQWGQQQPHDGDGDGVAVVDVGAVEGTLIFTDGFESGDTSKW